LTGDRAITSIVFLHFHSGNVFVSNSFSYCVILRGVAYIHAHTIAFGSIMFWFTTYLNSNRHN